MGLFSKFMWQPTKISFRAIKDEPWIENDFTSVAVGASIFRAGAGRVALAKVESHVPVLSWLARKTEFSAVAVLDQPFAGEVYHEARINPCVASDDWTDARAALEDYFFEFDL